MIVDERLTGYLHSLEGKSGTAADEIGAGARREGIPVVRPETAALLKVLIRMKDPENILEIGAAVGYSAILMSEFIRSDAHITTIENYEKRIKAAKENIQLAGKEDVITLLEGDAADILPELKAGYDFIFLDAAKGQYLNFLPEIMRILSPGGVLVSDNVLQEGSIISSRYAVTRRDRTIHSRMREYLWQIKHNDELETAVLTVGDGVSVSVRKSAQKGF